MWSQICSSLLHSHRCRQHGSLLSWKDLFLAGLKFRFICNLSTGEGVGYPLHYSWASLVAQLVKNLPAMQETWVQSLGWEDPLEKGKVAHSNIPAWRIPWTIHGVFLWDWNGNWPFPALWPLLSFPNLLARIPSPPLALLVVMLPTAHLTSHSRMSGSPGFL